MYSIKSEFIIKYIKHFYNLLIEILYMFDYMHTYFGIYVITAVSNFHQTKYKSFEHCIIVNEGRPSFHRTFSMFIIKVLDKLWSFEILHQDNTSITNLHKNNCQGSISNHDKLCCTQTVNCLCNKSIKILF